MIADSSCLVWEKKCGKTGNCWIYDQEKFRYRLHLVTIIFMTLGSVFDFALIFFADRYKNLYGDDEEDETVETTANGHEKQKLNELKSIHDT